jgi:hypothetical protein
MALALHADKRVPRFMGRPIKVVWVTVRGPMRDCVVDGGCGWGGCRREVDGGCGYVILFGGSVVFLLGVTLPESSCSS